MVDLAEDVRAAGWLELLARHHVDIAPQPIFQFQIDPIPARERPVEIDQQVDVAVLALLAADPGAEDAEIGDRLA